eukprot:1195665-Prorocentrum_minimum.AAC.2
MSPTACFAASSSSPSRTSFQASKLSPKKQDEKHECPQVVNEWCSECATIASPTVYPILVQAAPSHRLAFANGAATRQAPQAPPVVAAAAAEASSPVASYSPTNAVIFATPEEQQANSTTTLQQHQALAALTDVTLSPVDNTFLMRQVILPWALFYKEAICANELRVALAKVLAVYPIFAGAVHLRVHHYIMCLFADQMCDDHDNVKINMTTLYIVLVSVTVAVVHTTATCVLYTSSAANVSCQLPLSVQMRHRHHKEISNMLISSHDATINTWQQPNKRLVAGRGRQVLPDARRGAL